MGWIIEELCFDSHQRQVFHFAKRPDRMWAHQVPYSLCHESPFSDDGATAVWSSSLTSNFRG